jgi:hypothetical protein
MSPANARRAALLTVLAALLATVPAQAAFKKSIWGPVNLPGGESAFPTYEELDRG